MTALLCCCRRPAGGASYSEQTNVPKNIIQAQKEPNTIPGPNVFVRVAQHERKPKKQRRHGGRSENPEELPFPTFQWRPRWPPWNTTRVISNGTSSRRRSRRTLPSSTISLRRPLAAATRISTPLLCHRTTPTPGGASTGDTPPAGSSRCFNSVMHLCF